MKGYTDNIENTTKENADYRRVLYTAEHLQLVVMCLKSGEETGLETHDVDQFFRFESGMGKIVLDETEYDIKEDFAAVVPSGTRHNIINTGTEDLKLYTIYAPPEHQDGTIHPTGEDALSKKEHFDGTTTE